MWRYICFRGRLQFMLESMSNQRGDDTARKMPVQGIASGDTGVHERASEKLLLLSQRIALTESPESVVCQLY